MLQALLTVLILPAAALVLGQGSGSGPARVDCAETVLEGVVHCSSNQPRVVYVETEASLQSGLGSRLAAVEPRGLKFIPHVLPVLLGTRVAFVNSGPVRHNVFSTSSTKPFSVGTNGRISGKRTMQF
jgi:plastocyanin